MPITALGVVGPEGPQGPPGPEGIQGPDGPVGPAGTNIYVQPGDPGAVATGTLWLDTDDTTPDTSLNWGNIAGTLSNQTDLQAALNAKADSSALAAKLDTSAAPELIRDTMGTALVAGSNVTITPNDAGDTITIASSGGGGALPSYLLSGAIFGTVSTLGTRGTNVTQALTANTLYLMPCTIPEAMTLNLITLKVNTIGTAANARLGLFTMNTATNTATLVFDAGAAAVGTTGVKSLTISQAVSAGAYWLGVLADGTVSLNAFPAASGFTATAGDPANAYSGYLTLAATYGAFTSSYGPFTVVGGLNSTPDLSVRRA